MKTTLPKGDANRVTTLLGLRAGPMTSMEMTERWSFGTRFAVEMQRDGLVEVIGNEYRLTAAGRAACPFRNPLAATAAAPETFIMPKGETKLTRQQVLAAIVAAGPAGMSRAALIEKFAHLVSVQAIEMHMSALYRQQPPVVFKPKAGVMVALEFKTDAPAVEPAVNDPLPVAADDDLNKWVPEPLATDIDGISLAVDHHDAADLSTADLAKQMAQIAGLNTTPRYAVAFPGDFHSSVDEAVAQAVRDYESASLAQAVIIACTPLGRIEVRPVFVPEAA